MKKMKTKSINIAAITVDHIPTAYVDKRNSVEIRLELGLELL